MDIRYKGQSLTVGETLKDEIIRAVMGHSADGTAHGDLRALWAALAARAAALEKPCVFAVGNAPTALLTLCQLMAAGRLSPALVIGVPVGFVNVVESKELLFAACETRGVPAIAAMGRKGGSNVAAAICNALLYQIAR